MAIPIDGKFLSISSPRMRAILYLNSRKRKRLGSGGQFTASGGGTPVTPPPGQSNWILADGTWNDDGVWEDGETWNDEDPNP